MEGYTLIEVDEGTRGAEGAGAHPKMNLQESLNN